MNAMQMQMDLGGLAHGRRDRRSAEVVAARLSKGPAYRLTYKDRQQKTRTVYLRQDHLPRIRKMIANYARVRKLVDQLVEANIEVFKAETRR